MSDLQFARAGTPDWPQLWPIWHEVVAAGDTYCYDQDTTSEQAQALWLAEAAGMETWLVRRAGMVVGLYEISRNRPGAGAHVANGSYMVRAETRGEGVGRAMVEHSIDRARALGYRGIQFNAVVETNRAAIDLYRRLGFATIGVVPGGFRHPTEGYVDLHIMYRPL